MCLSHDEKLIYHTRRYSNCTQSHAKLLNLVSRGLERAHTFIERFIQVNNLTIARTRGGLDNRTGRTPSRVHIELNRRNGTNGDMLITLYISKWNCSCRCFGLRSRSLVPDLAIVFSLSIPFFFFFCFCSFSETMNFSLARAKQARVTDVALIHRKGCSARRENHISDVSVIAFISAARDWQCRHNQFFSRAQEKIGPRCWIDLSANDGETCRDNPPPPPLTRFVLKRVWIIVNYGHMDLISCMCTSTVQFY